jgi:DNA-binding transcriptional LysR family regulator
LEERRSESITQAVREGATDIGIIVEGTPTEGLACFDYRTDHLGVVVPKDHPLASKKVFFETLLDLDFVGLERRTAISRLLAAHAATANKPWRLRVEVNSFDAVCKMVQAGLGIGVLPKASARRVIKAMGLRLIPLADAWAARKILICVRKYESLPLLARQLVDHLVSQKGKPSTGSK